MRPVLAVGHRTRFKMQSTAPNPYKKLKKAELQALLIQWGQSPIGTVTDLMGRLADFDTAQTFSQDGGRRFLEFPGEVRNEIYKLVGEDIIQKTDSHAWQAIYSRKTRYSKKNSLERDSQLMVLQPGLFVSCKQIRTEGLPFFYQRHHFDLYLDHQKRVLNLSYGAVEPAFSRWFQAIGDLGQQNIRSLTLRYEGKGRLDCIERIHRRLSEKASVSYVAYNHVEAPALMQIALNYNVKNKNKVPLYFNLGIQRSLSDNDLSSFTPCVLEFPAESGWFGMVQNDKAQLWYRRDNRIEESKKRLESRQAREKLAVEIITGKMNGAAVVERATSVAGHGEELALEKSGLEESEMEDSLEGSDDEGKHEPRYPVAIDDRP